MTSPAATWNGLRCHEINAHEDFDPQGRRVVLGEHDVAVAKMASTLAGSIEISSSSEPCTPENVGEVVERMLVPLLGRKHRIPVAVGVSASRVFFGTRPTVAGSTSKPESELRKALSSSNLSEDDLIIELLRGKANKAPVARMAACRRRYIAGVVAALDRLGVRPLRAEPSPWALVRLAERQYRSPRWSRTVLRVFLGAGQGLVVAVSGGEPFGWKTFLLPVGSEGFAIVSAARGLKAQQGTMELRSRPITPWSTVDRTCTSVFRKSSLLPRWKRG